MLDLSEELEKPFGTKEQRDKVKQDSILLDQVEFSEDIKYRTKDLELYTIKARSLFDVLEPNKNQIKAVAILGDEAKKLSIYL